MSVSEITPSANIVPLPPHHGNPAQAGHALAHSREVVEQRRRAVLLPEALDLLDDFRHRLQQSGENCLERTTGTHTGVEGNVRPTLSTRARRRQRHGDRFTYIRGLLGGGGRYEKLPLAAEALHHHLCLERGKRRATETPVEPVSPTVDQIQNLRILPHFATLKEDDKHVETLINHVNTTKSLVSIE